MPASQNTASLAKGDSQGREILEIQRQSQAQLRAEQDNRTYKAQFEEAYSSLRQVREQLDAEILTVRALRQEVHSLDRLRKYEADESKRQIAVQRELKEGWQETSNQLRERLITALEAQTPAPHACTECDGTGGAPHYTETHSSDLMEIADSVLDYHGEPDTDPCEACLGTARNLE